MIDLIGKRVRIFLQGGASCEGTISSWDAENVLLTTEDSQNLLIINNPQNNILMIHVILKQDIKSTTHFETIKQQVAEPNPDELKLDHYEPDPTLRFKKLAELRQTQLIEHKKNLKRHLTTWKTHQGKKGYEASDYYEHPNFTNITSNSPAQKSGRSTQSNVERLSRVPTKPSKT